MSRRAKAKGGRVTPPKPRGACLDGCGRCCDPVVLPYAQAQVAAGHGVSERDRQWIVEELEPMDRAEAERLAGYLFTRTTVALVNGRKVPGRRFFYRCRNFDRETLQCGVYDHRPDACRQYPWYGGKPSPDMAIPPQCGYNVDVGRVPVAITRKPAALAPET